MSLRELIGNGKPMPSDITFKEKIRLISGNRMQNYPVDNTIGEDLDISTLVGTHNKRKEQRQQIYEMVYRKCCHRIRYANDVQYVKECYFRVPEVQLWNGIPKYETKAVIIYIMIKLKQKGLDVKYQPPDGVLVNWQRAVTKESSIKDREIRFTVDEINTATKPHDHIATAAERLAHQPCNKDCCMNGVGPRHRDNVSRERKLEMERQRQQDEIDLLIKNRDGGGRSRY